MPAKPGKPATAPVTEAVPAEALDQAPEAGELDITEPEATEAEAPAKKAVPALDLAALAAGAKVAPALPKTVRNTKGNHPLNPLLEKSIAENTAIQLPAFTGEANVLKLGNQLRRSATLLSTKDRKVTVTIRKTFDDEGGIVITFQARVNSKTATAPEAETEATEPETEATD